MNRNEEKTWRTSESDNSILNIQSDCQGTPQRISSIAMPPTNHFFPSTTLILILTLLQYLQFASSQSTSPSAAATSTLPAGSTPTAYPFYNFTYPTFPDHYQSGIQVSYKDTIDVAWVANGEQHAPQLQIQCWTRNDSSSFICMYYLCPPTLPVHYHPASSPPFFKRAIS